MKNLKLKRLLVTLLFSVLSIPIWIELLKWIIIPSNYESDGVTDLGYGFIIFFMLLPLLFIITFIMTWIHSKRIIFKIKNLRLKFIKD